MFFLSVIYCLYLTLHAGPLRTSLALKQQSLSQLFFHLKLHLWVVWLFLTCCRPTTTPMSVWRRNSRLHADNVSHCYRVALPPPRPPAAANQRQLNCSTSPRPVLTPLPDEPSHFEAARRGRGSEVKQKFSSRSHAGLCSVQVRLPDDLTAFTRKESKKNKKRKRENNLNCSLLGSAAMTKRSLLLPFFFTIFFQQVTAGGCSVHRRLLRDSNSSCHLLLAAAARKWSRHG